MPSNDINIPSGFLCRTETGTRAAGRATFSCPSPGTALARSRSPQQPRSLGRAAGWGWEGWQRDTGCSGTIGRSPGWRLDGDYVLMGTVPVGRSQHGAAGAMGSRKALLQRAETKGIRSQRFPHPKIKLYEHPKLFGSALELLQAKSKLSKEPSRHADEGSVKHEVQQPPPLAYQLVRAAERESRAAWGSAGAWEPPAKSTTPTLAFLPLPTSLGCSPARPADAQPALLCSAHVFPPAKEKKALRLPNILQDLRAGCPKLRQRFLLRSSYLFVSCKAMFRACVHDPEYLQRAVGSQPKRQKS